MSTMTPMHASPTPAYAPAPANDPYRGGSELAGFAPIGTGARRLYTAFTVVTLLGFFGTVFAWTFAIIINASEYGAPDEAWAIVAGVAFLVTIVMVYALAFTGIYWMYRAWSWLPTDQRYAKNWRSWITPSQAALLLLVPYFHYYWMFVINLGLCDALDRLRVTYSCREPAPRNLAMIACILQIVVPVPVAMIVWLVYMAKIERMTREMGAARHVPRAPAPT